MMSHDLSKIQIQELWLENSMYLAACPDAANPIICLQLHIKTGSAHECATQYGYAHFLEHLVFKSTAMFPDNGISQYAGDKGMLLNAYTDFDSTCYYILAPKERLAEALNILSQLAIYVRFTDADIAIERDIIIEEIYQYESDPETSFLEYIQANYFKKSVLSHPVLGTEASLKAASKRRLSAFYKKHYRPSNAFLVASGDFCFAELSRLFTQYFQPWAKLPASKPRPLTNTLPNRFSFHKRIKNGGRMLAIAIPELNETHPDSEALHIAIRHLAIGKSSLLHKELVEKRKLCSSVRVSSISGLIAGISVIVFAPTEARHQNRILDTFFQYWRLIQDHGVPEAAMALVKKDIIHSWLYSFEGVEHKANLIALEIFNQDLSRLENYGKQVEAISNIDLISAVRQHWQLKRLKVYYQGSTDFDYPKVQLNKKVKPLVPAPSQAISAQNTTDFQLCNNSKEAYYFRQLAGGLRLVYNYVPNRKITGFAISSPHSQLSEKLPGQNYFTSSMLLYGTQKHSHEELMQISRIRGFNIRVQHHLDCTIYRGKCHYQDLGIALNILKEILCEPRFDHSYFKILKSLAIDAIQREKEHPASYAYQKWFQLVFGKENNLYRSTGERKEIVALELQDCQAWHESWHLGRDFALAITGSIQPQELFEYCSRLFETAPASEPAFSPRPQYGKNAASFKRQYLHKEQAIIHIGGYASPAKNRVENTAFHLLAHVLGGELSSRFYAILREELGYAYQTGFDFSSISDLGYWCAYAFCDPEDYLDAFHQSEKILDDVLRHGISQQELDSAKNYLISMNRFDSESMGFRAAAISSLIALGYEADYYFQKEERIRSLRLADIDGCIQNWLQKDNRYIHVMV